MSYQMIIDSTNLKFFLCSYNDIDSLFILGSFVVSINSISAFINLPELSLITFIAFILLSHRVSHRGFKVVSRRFFKMFHRATDYTKNVIVIGTVEAISPNNKYEVCATNGTKNAPLFFTNHVRPVVIQSTILKRNTHWLIEFLTLTQLNQNLSFSNKLV